MAKKRTFDDKEMKKRLTFYSGSSSSVMTFVQEEVDSLDVIQSLEGEEDGEEEESVSVPEIVQNDGYC